MTTAEATPVDSAPARRGFVQLAFDVADDGRATNIRVLGAVPAGYFEKQAVARVAARRFAPGRGRSEIIEFEYLPARD